jgi:ABC-type antimicrobial peptide transport system permease subunit
VGIRIALGAGTGQVVAMIVRQGIRLVAIGLVLGIAASLGAGLLITNQLYGVFWADPFVIGIVSSVLLVVALIASWLPARRAARVNPVLALRAE